MNISFNDLVNNNSTGNKNTQSVEYFKLADGESAVVRFPYTSTDDFEIERFHEVPVEGQFYPKRVECLRTDIYDLEDNCVLCRSKTPLTTKFFVKMLKYNDGEIIINVWERPLGFAKELANLIKEYGDLSNFLFKITRTGKGVDTRYSLIPMLKTTNYENLVNTDISVLNNIVVSKYFVRSYEKYIGETLETLEPQAPQFNDAPSIQTTSVERPNIKDQLRLSQPVEPLTTTREEDVKEDSPEVIERINRVQPTADEPVNKTVLRQPRKYSY